MPVHPCNEVERVERELTAAMTARPRDAAACAAALERAVALARSDPDAAQAFDLAELLDLLAEEYDTLGRVDEALHAMRQALDVGWAGQPDGRCRLAEILMRAGRVAEAAPIWAQVRADTPDDVWLYNNAGLEYAAIGEHATAVGWLSDGLRLAVDTDDPEGLVGQLLDLRGASLAGLGREPDDLQARGEDFLAAAEQTAEQTPPRSRTPLAAPAASAAVASRLAAPAVRGEQTPVAWAWFPADEYDRALTRWPELTEPVSAAAGGRDHAGYCRAMQAKLRDAADAGMTGIRIAAIRIDAFLAWCAQRGQDPAESRAAYCADLAHAQPGQLIRWPPGRNEPCWCASARKYKKCCGAPVER